MKNRKKTILKLIPFGIAALLVLSHVISVAATSSYSKADGTLISTTILITVVYAGVGLLIILALILLKQHYWKLIFLVLILLSFGSIVDFSNWIPYIAFGSGNSGGIEINLISLFLLISHGLLNIEMFAIFKTTEAELTAQHETKVVQFEKRFQKKTIAELEQIIADNKLVPEAVEAARRLVNKV